MSAVDWTVLATCAVISLGFLLHPPSRVAAREIPSFLAERIDCWLLRQHGPFDAADDGTGPAICLLCKAEWPCEEFIAADRRIDERINSR